MENNTISDENLLISLSKGNETAFAEIYNRYWKQLLAIAYGNLKDKMLAEEVVQEVFISLWNRRTQIKIFSLKAYLATAVKFCTFKVIQKNKRHAEIENIIALEDQPIEESIIETKFLKEYLDGIVEQLPTKCRLVFKLSRESCLTNKEISQNLEISEKSVEAHITRALKVLKLRLQQVGIFSVFLFLF